MANDGEIEYIRTTSGQRKYNVNAFLGLNVSATLVCYCRVSSYKQKDDLERQVAFMQKKFSKAEIIKDIGSGLNFKRKGLRALVERAIKGEKLEVVVAYRDRLARFGFDLLEWIFQRNDGKIVVLDKSVFSPEQELTKDLLSILHLFSARLHGLRSYKSKIEKDLSNTTTEDNLPRME